MSFHNEALAIKDEIIRTTQKLIQFNTVRSEALAGAPFGQGNREALDYVLDIGERWGFKTRDLDGYIGYLEFGTGDEVVLIVPHLDVVPEGTEWEYPPFSGEVHNGRIYGRGAADDKGPAAASLYAFKLVRDSGLPVKKRVRLAFGLNEESGFACVQHYIAVEGLPATGFTPDGSFPVVNAEKGIIGGNFCKKLPAGTPKLIFTGGTAANVVPQRATAEFEGKRYEATGVPAHASTPEDGKNAILLLAEELRQSISHPVLDFLEIVSGAESLGIAARDEISGALTYNLALIDVNEQTAELTINIRYPVTADGNAIIEQLKAVAAANDFTFESPHLSAPHYVPADSPLIRALLNAYTEVTGLEGKPLALGGGTYARVLGNFAAFGGRLPDEPHYAHQRNESIPIDSLLKATEIYATAIYALAKD